jgi:hypothetical protein
MRVLYFVEDGAQETFIQALVTRAGILAGCQTDLWSHDARVAFGKGRVFRSLEFFLKDVIAGRIGAPNLLVVAVDADCDALSTRTTVNQLIIRLDYGGPVLLAIPDPHVERWYMADQLALQVVARCPGLPALPPARCRKDLFKNALRNAFRAGGVDPPLGGIEYAGDIVHKMDVFRARQNDSSLDRFFNEAQSLLYMICLGAEEGARTPT